jgi:hypothetical protein
LYIVKRKRHPESVLLFEPDLEELGWFVDNLNRELSWFQEPIEGGKLVPVDLRDSRAELRRLVQSWRDAGHDVGKVLNSNPVLAKAARRIRAQLLPMQNGKARLTYLTVPPDMDPASATSIAISHFLQFLLRPFNERLGGPCSNCGRYYVKKTNRQTSVYCSEECGHRLTSRIANKAKRDKEHSEQLKRVRLWIGKWRETRTNKPWKDWVSARTHVKKHWLTRAVKAGELVEPVKRERNRI